MKKKIYIVGKSSRAAEYGIGTYMTQLIDCLRQTKMEFGIIKMYDQSKDISVEYKNGYEHISIPPPITGVGVKGAFYSRNVAYLLRELIPAESDCEIIFHINCMTDETLVSSLKKIFKCKVLLTVHYTNWSFSLMGDQKKLDDIMIRKKKQLNKSEKLIRNQFEEDIRMVKKSDRVIYIAEHSAKPFSKYLKSPTELVINNGLKDTYKKWSSEKIRITKKKYSFTPEKRIILFAGRLDDVKGVKFLIKSFRRVLVTFPNTVLVIAGDGDFATLLKEAENIWSKIIFTGKVNKKKLSELYNVADLGVVSSIHEEFGYVAVEMMMNSLPVIASDTGGLAEIIEDGVSGLKVPVKTRNGQRHIDTVKLASKICLLLENEVLAEKIGKGGRQRFLEKYKLSIFRENIISLYNSL